MSSENSMSPINISLLVMILDVIFPFSYGALYQDLGVFVNLGFFMFASFWGTFFLCLLFHLAWIFNIGPGNYWSYNSSYQMLFETLLAPFYLLQSGVCSAMIGLFYLSSGTDFMTFSWIVLGLCFTASIYIVLMVESFVCKNKKDPVD